MCFSTPLLGVNLMKFCRSIILLLSLAISPSAFGVFPAKLPLPKMYETSGTILVGKITRLTSSNRLIDVDVVEALKGDKTDKLRVQLVSPEALFSQIHEGDPIVVCTSRGRGAGGATIHVADTFLVASLKSQTDPALWQIIQEQSNDFKKTFPGATG